jgi:hypothetical protein
MNRVKELVVVLTSSFVLTPRIMSALNQIIHLVYQWFNNMNGYNKHIVIFLELITHITIANIFALLTACLYKINSSKL